MTEQATCALCGDPMPEGEEMFKYHGYSGPCPKSPLPKEPPKVARRHQLPEGECSYCDRERANGSSFHPPHDASDRCESGKHNHCSCDTCF